MFLKFLTVAILVGLALCEADAPAIQSGQQSLDVDTRIVGGVAATIEQFPWTVSLQRYGVHRCGATIIAANRILTAAHCVVGISPRTLTIRTGSTNISSGGQVIKVSKLNIHSKYKPKTLENDIALMRLASRLNVNPAGVSIAPMSGYLQAVPVGAQAYVTGWGFVAENGNVNSNGLRSVGVPIVNQQLCNSLLSGITEGMICAGYREGGRDSCQNDSGGPLTVNGTLVGIVSWGVGCARPKRPGVYTRVAYYRKWIDQNV